MHSAAGQRTTKAMVIQCKECLDICYIDTDGDIDEIDQRAYRVVENGWRYTHRHNGYVCKSCRQLYKIKSKNKINTTMILLSEIADHVRKNKIIDYYKGV